MCNWKSKIVVDSEDDFGDIMIMALRYALGRKTFAPLTVVNFIKNNSNHITERIKTVMIRDLEEYFKGRERGLINDDKCDNDTFTDLLNFLKDGVPIGE